MSFQLILWTKWGSLLSVLGSFFFSCFCVPNDINFKNCDITLSCYGTPPYINKLCIKIKKYEFYDYFLTQNCYLHVTSQCSWFECSLWICKLWLRIPQVFFFGVLIVLVIFFVFLKTLKLSNCFNYNILFSPLISTGVLNNHKEGRCLI